MSYDYYRYGSYVGSGAAESHDKADGIQNLTSHGLTYSSAAAFLIKTINTHLITVPAGTYRIFMSGAGGGGTGYNSGGYSGHYGGQGGLFWIEATLPAGQYQVGIGAGGKFTNTTSYNPERNNNAYVMSGGQGSYGNGWGSGSGGGGTYLRWYANSDPGIPNWDRYIFIVGGGGGCASHNYTYNAGGHGFGVAGTAWSTELPNGSQYAGKNGFNSTGAGGNRRSGSNGYNDGGDANGNGQLYGGDAYALSNEHNGGGGGGGAGGGGAGGGGGNRTFSNASQRGGYISTNTTVSGYGGINYTAEVNPRGGGGGGGHPNDCGATGGGGGVLIFSDYNNSWGTTQGTHIPYWNGNRQNAGIYHIADYTAYNDLISYTNNYITGSPHNNYWNIASSSSGLYQRGYSGYQNVAGGDGFIFMHTLNKTMPYANIIQV